MYWSKEIGKKYSATIVGLDKARDVAILSVQGDDGNPLQPEVEFEGTKIAEIGIKVFVVGYPDYTPGQHAYVASASIATKYVRASVSVLELNTPLSEGISGGPVVDPSGKIIGIVTKGAKSGMGSNLATAYGEIVAAVGD